MQNIEWYSDIKSDIKDYSNSLPKDLYSIFMSIRDIILINLPFVTEQLINDIPTYFFRNKKLFYLICYADKVVLGFYHGNKIFDLFSLFYENNTKHTKEIYFKHINDTFNLKILPYLQESMKFATGFNDSVEIIESKILNH